MLFFSIATVSRWATRNMLLVTYMRDLVDIEEKIKE